MTAKPKPKRRPVTLVRSSYQPSKAEQEEPIEFPEGTTPDDLAEAVVRPVDVHLEEPPEIGRLGTTVYNPLFLDAGEGPFGVTANHVIEGWEEDRTEGLLARFR